MSEITADELLRRIRAARAVAAGKEAELRAASEAGSPDNVSLGLALKAHSYRTVIEVLDLIVDPTE
ncbi:hypothetical protein ABTX71_13025 [Streptomyces parvulus]|uniref:hypothetical protein n=1 Tax=Streptomyces parvulus TaxID=146923 RepID=UPI0033220EE4